MNLDNNRYNLTMKIYNKTLFVIILATISFFIVNEILSYNIELKEEVKLSYKRDKLILKNLFSAQEKYLSAVAIMLSSDDIVIKSLKQNRPILLQKHLEVAWEKLKEDKLIYEIHFFKPPAISFVNFSNFKSIGKDVSKVRTDILWVTSSFQESSHVLMCKTYAGYRVTEPIVDANGTMLGGLSLGKKVDWIPRVIKEKTSHNAFLIYNKKATITLMPKYYKNFMKNKKIFGNFILANKTINISVQDLKNINFKKSVQNIYINDEKYKLFSYPIIDFNKNTMGYLCTVTQLEEFKNRFINFSIKEVVLIFLTSIILIFINDKNNKRILRHINHIKNITNNIKQRNFSILHDSNIFTDKGDVNSLIEIEKNIINMGISLEEQYIILENDNKTKSEQLITQLYTDDLTGLGNRNALLRDLKKFNHSFVALLNIRGFKSINDAFGFRAGNYILKSLSNTYLEMSDNGLIVYRISNDEFAIINNHVLSTKEFTNFIENTIKKLDIMTFKYHSVAIKINLYAGICLDTKRKLSKATIALSQAKDNKSEYEIYNKNNDIQGIQAKNIELINKISHALLNDNIIMYFQPIVDKHGTINKYESLVRLRDKDEILSPFAFLEISKKTKMYSAITKVVINKTFDKFHNSDKLFSLNITANDIVNPNIVELIYKKLDACKDTKQVIFELVESDDLFNIKNVDTFLKNIKEKGAKIAIDDFGTGYSNFSYIMKIKPDYLKIDGSLIKNIDTDISAYKTVKTIVNFAHNMGISTIAEFVHNKEVFDICRELNIDEFQGYFFGEPKEEII